MAEKSGAPTGKAGPPATTSMKRKRGRGADPESTRQALVDAAISSLIEVGYAGTTARSIASRADCNQAAIYYHFGGIEPLLIAALKASSARRLERYKNQIVDATDLMSLVGELERLYAEDRESGHLGLLAELVGGITASPELRQGIEESTEPWLVFVESRIREAASTVPFGPSLPTGDIADLIFSLVIGVELRSKIDENDERPARLFRLARLAATLATAGAEAGE